MKWKNREQKIYRKISKIFREKGTRKTSLNRNLLFRSDTDWQFMASVAIFRQINELFN